MKQTTSLKRSAHAPGATPVVRLSRAAGVIVVFSLATSSGLAQTAPTRETLTLPQVVRDVVRQNDRVRAAAFMEEAERRRVGPAGAWDDPMLMLGVQNLPTSFRFDEDMMTMKMVGLSQRIPYAGEKGLLADAQRAKSDAIGEEKNQVVIDLVAAAKTAFVEVYYHQELINSAERQKELYDDIATTTQSRVAANLAGTAELSMAQAAAWRAEAEILGHHNDAHDAHYRLDALRGVGSESPLPTFAPPEFPPLPDSINGWIDSARANYPPLRRLLSEAEQYRLSAAASRRMALPMLELSAAYGFREDLRHEGGHVEPQGNMWSFAVGLSLPFFKGRQERWMAKSMTAMQRQAEAERLQAERDVMAGLRGLHQRAQRLKESIALYRERIIPADEDAYRSGLAGYSSGQTTLTGLLDYVVRIYRDHSMASQLEMEFARTMIAAERFVMNADALSLRFSTE